MKKGVHRRPRPESRIGDSSYSFASQLAQSVVSFFLVTAVAHAFSPEQFGHIAVFAIILTLVMSLNRTVFGEQLLVASQTEKSIGGYLALQLLSLIVVLLSGAAVSYLLFGSAVAIGVLVLAAHTAADGIRYAAMVGHSTAPSAQAVCVVDSMRAALAGIAFGISISGGSWSVTCSLGVIVSIPWVAYCVRKALPGFRHMFEYVTSLGRFEGYVLAQYFLATGASQCIPLAALPVVGSETVGSIRLAQSVINPVTVLALSAQPALLKWMARRSVDEIIAKAKVALSISVTASFLAFGVLYVSRPVLVGVFVPDDLASQVNAVWVPIAISLCVVIAGQPGGALIRYLRLGGLSFSGQVAGVVAGYSLLAAVYFNSNAEYLPWAICFGALTSVCATYFLLALHVRSLHNSSRVANHSRSDGGIRHYDRVGADDRVVSDVD